MRTRFRDGGIYYMGGKYPSFSDAGMFSTEGNPEGEKTTTTTTTRLATEQASAQRKPEYTQSETAPGSNLFGGVTSDSVQERLQKESSWFDPNDPIFGEGGFDHKNSAHVTIYQKRFNETAPSGQQIEVDGDWGEQTQSAHIPTETVTTEEKIITPPEQIPDPEPEPEPTEGDTRTSKSRGRAGIAGDRARYGYGKSAHRGLFGRKGSSAGRNTGRGLFTRKPTV
tara:strand:+ start:331 stop:1005 length:675 start_codon:yes stop_codon:yes gene_type:complete